MGSPIRRIFPLIAIAMMLAVSALPPLDPTDGDRPGISPVDGITTPLPREETGYGAYIGEALDGADVIGQSGLVATSTGLAPNVGGSGHMVSKTYAIHEGRRWDFAYAEVALGEGEVTLQVRDPTNGVYPTSDLLKFAMVDSPTDHVTLDLWDIDHVNVTGLELVVLLDHSGHGGTPPEVRSWRLGDCDVDLWHDPFYDVGRDEARGHLSLGGGEVRPVQTHIPGGLLGDYYDSTGFANFAFTRLDQVIDFDWGNGNPGGGMGNNRFSIDWEGKIMVPRTESYTLYLRVDDGGRLWVDGNRIIDEWRDQGATEFSATVPLTEGLHDIQVHYYEQTGGALCQLRWSSPSISKRIIPYTALWGREATNELVSEEISLPEGHRWDLLLLDYYDRGNGVLFDVLDAGTDQPVFGFNNIERSAVDLTRLSPGAYPAIKLRARFREGPPANSSVVLDWGVKWMPERTWRCEFLTDLRVAGSVGVLPTRGYVLAEPVTGSTDMMAFAEALEDGGTPVDSTLYRGWYMTEDIPTTDASDVAVADLDGDGIGDVVFTSSVPGSNATAYRGSTAGFDNAPEWTLAHDSTSRPEAYFTAVLAEDLDGSGGGLDIVLVETNSTASYPYDRLLFYHWNGAGWNATPDLVVECRDSTVVSIDAGDVNGDEWQDIAMVLESATNGVYLLEGGPEGYTQWNWTTVDTWGTTFRGIVHVGDLTGDRFDDLAFGTTRTGSQGGGNTGASVLYGSSDGLSSSPDFRLSNEGSVAMTFADWNGDGNRDIAILFDDLLDVQFHPFSGMHYTVYITGGVDIATVQAGSDDKEELVVAGNSDVPRDANSSWFLELMPPNILYTRVLTTTGARAVDAGRLFPNGISTIRTAVIEVDEPKEAGRWSHVSYRALSGQMAPTQSVEVRLLDAETGEVLWMGTSGRGEASMAVDPPVSARAHGRVYMEVRLDNQDEFRHLGFAHLEVNWTERVPAPPDVLSLEADDPVIYRTNATTLGISVRDELDLAQEMSVFVQMRPPGAGGWITDRLGTPVWDGERWAVTFATTRDDPTGNYSFRCRATDTDMMDSQWLEVDGLVRVLNNPPGTPGIEITPAGPRTSDDLRCEIVRQALDRDTSGLDYRYVWYLDGSAAMDLDGPTVPRNRTLRGQEWRVFVRAFDGEDLGPLVEASTTILNSPPRLIEPLGPLNLREDAPKVTFRISQHVVDPDGDDIVVSSYASDEGVIFEFDMDDDWLSVTPEMDWSGNGLIHFNVTDGEEPLNITIEYYVTAEPDAPRVVSIGGVEPVDGRFHLEAWQKAESRFLVVVEDVDSTSFYFESPAEDLFSMFTLVAGNGTMIFEPVNAEVGNWTFNLSVRDDTHYTTVVPIDITVHDVNDPPGFVYIQLPRDGRVFDFNATVLMQGSCSDPDEIHGQKLTFTWLSDIDGELGTGASYQTNALSAGDHVITLRVFDGLVEKASSVHIKVLPKSSNGGGNGGGNGGNGPLDPIVSGGSGLGLLLLLLIIVIAVAAAVLTRKRLRGRPSAAEGSIELEPEEEGEFRIYEGVPASLLREGKEAVDGGQSATDMRSVMLGRGSAGPLIGEDLPASPWSDEDLRTVREAVRPPATTAPTRPVPSAPSDWEEEPTEAVPPPPTRPPSQPPPPTPPPTPPPQQPPQHWPPPQPSAPARQPTGRPPEPPRKKPPKDDGWEEL